jgi:hypothetical protein
LKINSIIKYGDSNFGQGYIYMREGGERERERRERRTSRNANCTTAI